MDDTKINQEVMRILHDNTRNNEIIREFLLDLIGVEYKLSGSWKYKNQYKEIIKKYAQKGDKDINEDWKN